MNKDNTGKENVSDCQGKEVKIYEFDPQIYPRKLWVAITRKTLSDTFDTNLEELDDSDNARVDNVHNKITNMGGLLVRFEGIDAMTASTITHEAAHVAAEIFEYVDAKFTFDNQEPFAYLIGWVSKCIDEVRQEEIKQG